MKICALGAATSAHVMARAAVFREFGHEVTVISPCEVHDNHGLQTIACPRAGRGRAAWLWSVIQAVRGVHADVYHAHYAAELTTWACWVLRKRPLVITVMGGDVLFDEQGSLGFVGRWLTRRALKSADLVTVKSALLGDVVAGFGVARERIMDVVWGVDARVFKPDAEGALARRADWGCRVQDRVLFSPRMLKPLYNQVLMVEALAHIPDAKLVLSTYNEDPIYRAEVEAKARDLNVGDRVVFVPAVEPGEMAASYSAADVVLSLPPSDGTPQSVMEAMACATPVVMTDLERFKPFFTHNQTVWFTALKAQSVAAAVAALLAEDGARVAVAARELVREHADFETQACALERRLADL